MNRNANRKKPSVAADDSDRSIVQTERVLAWLRYSQKATDIAKACPDIHFECVKKRWIKKTLREVYIGADRLVVKRFIHYPGLRDYRKPWVQEHRAMKKLQGLNVPTSFGYYYTKTSNGVPAVILCRSFVKGSPIIEMDTRIQTQAANLLV